MKIIVNGVNVYTNETIDKEYKKSVYINGVNVYTNETDEIIINAKEVSVITKKFKKAFYVNDTNVYEDGSYNTESVIIDAKEISVITKKSKDVVYHSKDAVKGLNVDDYYVIPRYRLSREYFPGPNCGLEAWIHVPKH